MGGLLLPQGESSKGHSRVGGRVYPEATRPADPVVIAGPTIKHSEIGQKIDGLQRKMREFRLRCQDVPYSFIDEMKELLASLEEEPE